MKKIFISIFAVCLLGAAGLAVAKLASQQQENSSSGAAQGEKIVCDFNAATTYNFKNGITLKIPKAFSYDPVPGAYEEGQETGELFLSVIKNSLEPASCSNNIYSENATRITVLASSASYLNKILQNYLQKSYTKKISIEKFDPFFTLYEKNQDMPGNRHILFVPKEKQNLFFECNYRTTGSLAGKIAGCSVQSAFGEKLRVLYGIKEEDILNYKKINQDLENLVLGFVVKDTGR